jgi:hypothetical protein
VYARKIHESNHGLINFLPYEERLRIEVPKGARLDDMLEVLNNEYPTWQGWLTLYYEVDGVTHEYC